MLLKRVFPLVYSMQKLLDTTAVIFHLGPDSLINQKFKCHENSPEKIIIKKKTSYSYRKAERGGTYLPINRQSHALVKFSFEIFQAKANLRPIKSNFFWFII